jgi:hypothetical protein
MLIASIEVEIPSRTTICAMCRVPGIACSGEVSANKMAGGTCAVGGTGGRISRSCSGGMSSQFASIFPSAGKCAGCAPGRTVIHRPPWSERFLA